MFSITISEKGGQQSKLDFSKSEITIGRMKGNDIVLPKSNVSKQHTRIFLRDNGFFIVDLKSTNGTYVNGRKVAQEQPLTEADKVYIGDFILQVEKQLGQVPSAGPPQPPQPPPGGPSAPSGPGGGRHFPTVMDGPSGAMGRAGGPPPSQSQAGQAPKGRQPSMPGAPITPPAPNPGPPQDDLRRTVGDAGPLDFGFAEPVAPVAESTPVPPSISGAPAAPAPAAPAPAVSSPSQPTPAVPSPSPVTPIAPSPAHRPGIMGVQAVASQKPLENEFDEMFHHAQQDVARIVFESVAAHELPLDYPVADGPDRSRIEQIVRDAVSTVSPQVDQQALTDAVIKEVLGLGPLEDYLDDPAVQSIYVNGYDRIILRREGSLLIAARAYGHPDLLDLAARRLLGPQEIVPVSDEVRFSDGTRVHILMPPLSVDGPTLTVRKPNNYFPNLAELAEQNVLSAAMAEFLERAVEAGRSIVIAGPTSSGKSTLLAALTELIPASTRVIAVEQHSSLPMGAPSFLRLEASPSSGFDMRFLLANAVAMHPERILLDECRGAEGYDWVTAAASGTDGSMLTLHGTSASDALGRLESMCLLGAGDISPRGLREQIARSVDLVVVLHGTAGGDFRVHQIAEVQGVDLDAFRLNDVFYYRVDGTAGAFHPTGYIPLFYEDLRHAGIDVDLDIFRE